MKKRKTRKPSTRKRKPGELLVQSLTREQIALLLDVLLAKGDISRHAEALEAADPDMAETVTRSLEAASRETAGPVTPSIASEKRTIEQWDALWGDWENVVIQVGDEEGKYALQDAHWEPPFFDGYELAEDLDEIAGKMLGLIEKVFHLADDSELFTKALAGIERNIADYPDWMPDAEPCTLEKNATLCVLKWLWLASRDGDRPGRALLHSVRALDTRFEYVELEDDTCVTFFADLPDAVCREIFDRLGRDYTAKEREDLRSKWHHIHHAYEKRFDSAAYLKTCRRHLAMDWRYGGALIDDALSRGDRQEAEALLERTFTSYVSSPGRKKWYPETSLLWEEARFGFSENEEEVAGLLDTWARVSKALGHAGRSAASQWQAVVFRAPEDWKGIIDTYKKLCKPAVKGVLDPLLSRWQTVAAQKGIDQYVPKDLFNDTWIHWLITAELDPPGKRAWFIKKVDAWLGRLGNDGKDFKKQWPLLARLTRDLPGGDSLRKSHPAFFENVLPWDDEPSMLDEARSKALERMKAGPCLSSAMEAWNHRLKDIVPDPGRSHKSRYENHARWMRALHEVNEDAYQVLLARWQKTHNRRRNLWRDMEAQDLPL